MLSVVLGQEVYFLLFHLSEDYSYFFCSTAVTSLNHASPLNSKFSLQAYAGVIEAVIEIYVSYSMLCKCHFCVLVRPLP
jgi:hypothetical protein